LEGDLGASKEEAGRSAEKLESSEELLKEVQDVNLRLQAELETCREELEGYKRRAQRAEGVILELQNQASHFWVGVIVDSTERCPGRRT
jgi:hypothetical protein